MFRTRNTFFRKNVEAIDTPGAFASASGEISLDPNLRKILKKLIEWANLYLAGDLTTLREELTLDIYTKYSRKIFSLKTRKLTDTELVRRTAASFLTTLYSALSIYEDYQIVTLNNTVLKERVKTLDDMDLLREYLEELQRNLSTEVFGSHDVSVTAVNVNPEYIEYIQRYGYPLNGVFDSDLLGAIAQNMKT